MSAYFFLHVPSGRSWLTDDPHRWLLARRDETLLAPARERLHDSADDNERCVRVVLRRCGLTLLQTVSDARVVVRHWGQPAPDLRAWARAHGWNRPGVPVAFEDLKSGATTLHADGQDVLMDGRRVGPAFPWSEYLTRYERRHIQDGDDEDAAPASSANFGWPGVADGRMTWRVLKAIWNAEGVLCSNCDAVMILTAFSWTKGPLSFRSARIVRHCPGCRRGFESEESEPLAWVASVLPPDRRPTRVRQWREFEIDWDRLVVRPPRPVQRVGGDG